MSGVDVFLVIFVLAIVGIFFWGFALVLFHECVSGSRSRSLPHQHASPSECAGPRPKQGVSDEIRGLYREWLDLEWDHMEYALLFPETAHLEAAIWMQKKRPDLFEED